MNKPLLEVDIPGIPRYARGKIRDVFKVGDDILVITTDRVFLFDQVYPEGLAGKGKTLTALTCHTYPEMLSGRSLLAE